MLSSVIPAIRDFAAYKVLVLDVSIGPYIFASIFMPQDLPTIISEETLRTLRETLNSLKDDPEFQVKYVDRLNAADVGFFAFNASLDDSAEDDFHPSFLAFRERTKDAGLRARVVMQLRRALFDHVGV